MVSATNWLQTDWHVFVMLDIKERPVKQVVLTATATTWKSSIISNLICIYRYR